MVDASEVGITSLEIWVESVIIPVGSKVRSVGDMDSVLLQNVSVTVVMGPGGYGPAHVVVGII